MSPARKLGLRSGGGVPVFGPAAAKATLQVAMDADAETFRKRFRLYQAELKVLAEATHARLVTLSAKAMQGTVTLTSRQLEILRAVDETGSTKAAAASLATSDHNVKQIFKEIFGRLNVKSRVSAIREAKRLGLIP